MTQERPLRLFVAVELPPEARAALRRMVEPVRSAGVGPLRWVDVESIHLTLKFLGDVAPQRVPGLEEALTTAAQGHAPFTLHLAEGGVFPNRQAPRVVWVSLQGDREALSMLREDVDQALVGQGFPPETRAFIPHLTVARVRGRLSADERTRLGDALERVSPAEGAAIPVGAVSLMQSTLLPSGALHERLLQAPLAAALSSERNR